MNLAAADIYLIGFFLIVFAALSHLTAESLKVLRLCYRVWRRHNYRERVRRRLMA